MVIRKIQWSLALLAPLTITVYFVTQTKSADEDFFMPGPSSHGHYQIEMKCAVCHEGDSPEVIQNACVQCHADELKRANDSHPKAKFLDPRNANRLQHLNARECMSCHREHQPDQTLEMGLTIPQDYCFFCHQDIAEERPSHVGMGYETCATAGCHNYHDNSALYEDFIAKHLDELPVAGTRRLPERNAYQDTAQPLSIAQRDAPDDVAYSQNLAYDWATTAHAKAGVNCAACHAGDTIESSNSWIQQPDHTSCQECHGFETETFLQGKHGMRLAQDLPPMTPAQARIPMHAGAAHKELSCLSCHSDHRFDTQYAAAEACMKCHDDTHTNNYKNSQHHQLWLAESVGNAPAGSGVSCASCHMPRITIKEFGEEKVRVQHNQNDTLRPNEKMIRPVCMNCHGLPFSIDALADETLIENNFATSPSVHIETVELVAKRLLEQSKR